MRLTSASLPIPKHFRALLLVFRMSAFAMTGNALFLPAMAQGIVHPYRTPQAIALQSKLNAAWDKPIAKQPLLGLAQDWSIANGIPVWIDRRIASDLLVTLENTPNTLGDAIASVAHAVHAEVAIIDRVVLLVPEGRSECVEQAYWSLAVSNLPGPLMRVEKTGMAWEEGTNAASLITEFLQRYRIADRPATSFEQDLWRSQRWEQVAPAAVGLCILSGFDLGLKVEADRAVIGPLCTKNDLAAVAWTYRDEIQRIGRDAWQSWRQRWDAASVERLEQDGAIQWRITAPIRAHRELVASLAPAAERTHKTNPQSQRFTGRYRGELHLILKSLATQMQLELKLPELPEQVLRQELDLSFQDLTVDEIIEKIVFASGLTVRRDGDQLTVESK